MTWVNMEGLSNAVGRGGLLLRVPPHPQCKAFPLPTGEWGGLGQGKLRPKFGLEGKPRSQAPPHPHPPAQVLLDLPDSQFKDRTLPKYTCLHSVDPNSNGRKKEAESCSHFTDEEMEVAQ